MPVPEKPALEGLEARWTARWEESGVYRFDRTRPRDQVFSIDTPPPTVSGSLHVGHVFSYTHTDVVARFQRMRGQGRVLPDGVGRQRPADRAPRAELLRRPVRSVAAVRPVVRAAGYAAQAARVGVAAELRRALRAADGGGREGVRAPLEDARAVGRLVDDVRDDRSPVAARQPAGVPAPPDTRPGVSGRGPDAVGRGLQDGRRSGGARGPRARRRVSPRPVRRRRPARRSTSKRRGPS